LIEPSGHQAVVQVCKAVARPSVRSARKVERAGTAPRGQGTPQHCPSWDAGGVPSSQAASTSGVCACALADDAAATTPTPAAPCIKPRRVTEVLAIVLIPLNCRTHIGAVFRSPCRRGVHAYGANNDTPAIG
jgi:hypothetical protein